MEGKRFSLSETIYAGIIGIVVFVVCFFIIAPIVYEILYFLSKIFVDARYGGGENADNIGGLRAFFHSLVISVLSTIASYKAVIFYFEKLHLKYFSLILAAFTLSLGALYFAAFLNKGASIVSAFAILFCISCPSCVIAYIGLKTD